jgi:hypothetical protein
MYGRANARRRRASPASVRAPGTCVANCVCIVGCDTFTVKPRRYSLECGYAPIFSTQGGRAWSPLKIRTSIRKPAVPSPPRPAIPAALPESLEPLPPRRPPARMISSLRSSVSLVPPRPLLGPARRSNHPRLPRLPSLRLPLPPQNQAPANSRECSRRSRPSIKTRPNPRRASRRCLARFPCRSLPRNPPSIPPQSLLQPRPPAHRSRSSLPNPARSPECSVP